MPRGLFARKLNVFSVTKKKLNSNTGKHEENNVGLNAKHALWRINIIGILLQSNNNIMNFNREQHKKINTQKENTLIHTH